MVDKYDCDFGTLIVCDIIVFDGSGRRIVYFGFPAIVYGMGLLFVPCVGRK